MNKNLPAISVIIPMYNAEKFIGACLRSVFKQSFTDYEIIIVDDCSTDRSVEIVENMIDDQNNKSKSRLVKLNKNSGGAAIPRNVGLKLSRGIYVTFLDSDDMLMPNALEVLIDAALKNDADVVHSEGFLEPIEVSDHSFKVKGMTFQAEPYVDEPTLETDNIAARIERFCALGYLWNVWSKLFRRDLLIENQIEFVNARTVEDMIFVFECVCCAPRYVRIPEMFYIYRKHKGSITHADITLEQRVKRYASSLSRGIKELATFFDRQTFFADNPQYKTKAIQFLFELHFGIELHVYKKMPPHETETLLRATFAEEPVDDLRIVTGYLLNIMGLLRIQLSKNEELLKSVPTPTTENTLSTTEG